MKYVGKRVWITFGLLVVLLIFARVFQFHVSTNMFESLGSTISEKEEKETYSIHNGDLILVNKDYPLVYSDFHLVEMKSKPSDDYFVSGSMKLSENTLNALNTMMEAYRQETKDGTTLIKSGFRTKAMQRNIYDRKVKEMGKETAERLVAYPGVSEHQTGLAIDFGILFSSGLEGSFSKSTNSEWMQNNANKFGFVQRYQASKEDITGIRNELWHYRYVGYPHAAIMEAYDMCLEEYITFLKAYTSDNKFDYISSNGLEYSIYYINDATFYNDQDNLISNELVDVSGNNIDGFIITETLSQQSNELKGRERCRMLRLKIKGKACNNGVSR